jgi:hypothetical protein
MSRLTACIVVAGAFGIVGCAGSSPAAESASNEGVPPATATPAPESPSGDTDPPAESAAESAPATTTPDTTADVKFPDGASVAEAVAAVPRGTSRSNLDAETLAEPLQEEKLWAPCNVGAQHFKVKVAVWNGHAVGVDVTSSSKPIASCVEKQVRAVEWRDKVRSLNTVEYSM